VTLIRGRRGKCLGEAGYTLAELVMVCTIMSILAAAAMPIAKFTSKRAKEAELSFHLRTMRTNATAMRGF